MVPLYDTQAANVGTGKHHIDSRHRKSLFALILYFWNFDLVLFVFYNIVFIYYSTLVHICLLSANKHFLFADLCMQSTHSVFFLKCRTSKSS